MSRAEKLIARFREQPSDFTWNELVRLLEALDYTQAAPGNTSGPDDDSYTRLRQRSRCTNPTRAMS